MAVYTTLSKKAIENILANYDCASLKAFQGIDAGTVNTNYVVEVEDKKFVLTLFEKSSLDEITTKLELIEHLYQNNYPTPKPERSKKNKLWVKHGDKYCALMEFVEGQYSERPNPKMCSLAGQKLAQLHIITKEFIPHSHNKFGWPWRKAALKMALHDLKPQDKALAQDMYTLFKKFKTDDLPKAIIHADYFRDNVLFCKKESITAVLDFDYACFDVTTFDIAIAINDWCTNFDGKDFALSKDYVEEFISGYHSVNKLDSLSQQSLNKMLQFAAWQLWMYRVYQAKNLPSSDFIAHKPPETFKYVLLDRIAHDSKYGSWMSLTNPK